MRVTFLLPCRFSTLTATIGSEPFFITTLSPLLMRHCEVCSFVAAFMHRHWGCLPLLHMQSNQFWQGANQFLEGDFKTCLKDHLHAQTPYNCCGVSAVVWLTHAATKWAMPRACHPCAAPHIPHSNLYTLSAAPCILSGPHSFTHQSSQHLL